MQAFLESKGVRVFQAASRGTNMCMKILPRPMEKVQCYFSVIIIVPFQWNCFTCSLYMTWPIALLVKHAMLGGHIW